MAPKEGRKCPCHSPSDSDPRAAGETGPAPRKRPWGWIAAAGLLGTDVIGLGIYSIRSAPLQCATALDQSSSGS